MNKAESAFMTALLPVLREKGDITAFDAVAATGKSPQRVSQLFAALVEKDVLIATGQNKGRKYKLKS